MTKNYIVVNGDRKLKLKAVDIDAVMLWLLENDPKMYFGCNIIEVDNQGNKTGNVSMIAVIEFFERVSKGDSFEKIVADLISITKENMPANRVFRALNQRFKESNEVTLNMKNGKKIFLVLEEGDIDEDSVTLWDGLENKWFDTVWKCAKYISKM